MSGVIDKNGQQWEHCCNCGKFVKYQDLQYGYSHRWPQYDAVDLCLTCYNALQVEDEAEDNSPYEY